MTGSIDDTVKSIEQEQQPIEAKQSVLEKIVNKTIDMAIIGAAATFYLTSSALTFTGFFIADLIMKKKRGERLSFNNVVKTAYNNMGDAALNGGTQEEMYRAIDSVPNYSFIQKIIKTLTFNPGVIMAYSLYYQVQQYIRNDIGYVKAIKALFNPELRRAYFRDFYKKKLEGQYWGKVWTVFKRIFPIHFGSINYITQENMPGIYMPLRMGIAANNDVIFALASKPEKRKV